MRGKFSKIDIKKYRTAIFLNPNAYLCQVNFRQCSATLIKMNCSTYRESVFLDSERVVRLEPIEYKIDLNKLLCLFEEINPATKPCHYIFHIAFCGSTLISKCLGELRGVFSLREPSALTYLSLQRRRITAKNGFNFKQWSRAFKLVTFLQSRTYRRNEVSLIKANDLCNNLIPELINQHQASRGIFLYTNLQEFLISVCNNSRIDWVKKRLKEEMLSRRIRRKLANLDLDALSDLQKASLLWYLRISNFVQVVESKKYQYSPIRSLNFQEFLNSPASVLRALAKHFNINLSSRRLNAILQSKLMTVHSKTSRPFNKESLDTVRSVGLMVFGPEIQKAMEWLESGKHGLTPLPTCVPRQLMAE